MTIRRTFQFNTQDSVRNDGIILNNPCDIHGKMYTDNTIVPYAVDLSGSDDLLYLGDSIGRLTGSSSLPVKNVSGLHYTSKIINSASYTVTPDDLEIFADTSSNNITINLPQLSAITRLNGKLLIIHKTSHLNNLTIDPYGCETINGYQDLPIIANNYGVIFLIADQTNTDWKVIKEPEIIKGLLYNYDPSFSTDSTSYVTIDTSTSTFFNGRNTLFIVNGSARQNAGYNAFISMNIALQFDGAGTDYLMGKWCITTTDFHTSFSCAAVIDRSVLTRNTHTVSLRIKKNSGTGPFNMDASDFYQLRMVQV